MEKSINDYDENLRQLERQREQLEQVMKMMGQEWEERFVLSITIKLIHF